MVTYLKQWFKSNVKPILDDCLLSLEVVISPVRPHKHFRESFLLWLANNLPRSHRSDRRLRSFLLRKAGVNITDAVVWHGIQIRPIGAASRIEIGKGCFINSEVRFECAPEVTIKIGARVQVGSRCSFETMNHSVVLLEKNKRGGFPASIVIEDDVWLAARVTILPGVTIGKGSVVAAGAVVTKDVPPFTLVGGVPAKKIKEIKPEEPRELELIVTESSL
jgi:maltose O-acetyltransferase